MSCVQGCCALGLVFETRNQKQELGITDKGQQDKQSSVTIDQSSYPPSANHSPEQFPVPSYRRHHTMPVRAHPTRQPSQHSASDQRTRSTWYVLNNGIQAVYAYTYVPGIDIPEVEHTQSMFRSDVLLFALRRHSKHHCRCIRTVYPGRGHITAVLSIVRAIKSTTHSLQRWVSAKSSSSSQRLIL